MSHASEQLNHFGYSDCFYQDGQLWGFLHHNVMPVPIPDEILQAANLHTPRNRLISRAQHWCDRRGIRARTRSRPRSQNM